MANYMILEYTFKDNGHAQLQGPNIKYWKGEGLPSYEGSIDGFAIEFPQAFAELLTNQVIKGN